MMWQRAALRPCAVFRNPDYLGASASWRVIFFTLQFVATCMVYPPALPVAHLERIIVLYPKA